jgi:hypothetical protein
MKLYRRFDVLFVWRNKIIPTQKEKEIQSKTKSSALFKVEQTDNTNTR